MVTLSLLTALLVLENCGRSLATLHANTTGGVVLYSNATSLPETSSPQTARSSQSIGSTSADFVQSTASSTSSSSTDSTQSLSTSAANVAPSNSTTSRSTTSSSPGLGSYILAGLNGVQSSSASHASSVRSSRIASNASSPSTKSTSRLVSTFSQSDSTNVNASKLPSTDSATHLTYSAGLIAATTSVNGSTSSSVLQGTGNVSNNASILSTVGFTNISIASTGSGFDYASSCNALLLSWTSALDSSRSVYTVYTTYTSTDVMSETDYSTSIGPSMTTLCDGVAHVLGGSASVAATGYVTYWSYVFTESVAVKTRDNFTTVAKPDCTINAADCASLYSSYTSAAAVQDTVGATSPAQLPACDYATASICTSCCSSCTIAADNVQMMYWPPTLIGNECAANRTYITGTPTRPGYPNTKVIGNQTYTSPTVYLSFESVRATYGHEYCGGDGNDAPNTVVALLPEDVSSIRFKQYTNCTTCHEGPNTYTMAGIYPVDYADFVGPVPADAYRGQAKCVYDYCSTITDASYSPFLSVPAQLKSLDAAWSDCVLYIDGIWDPPVPLTPVASEAGVTTPTVKGTTTTAAQPSSSIKSSFASSTATVTTSARQSPSTQAGTSVPSQASSTAASTVYSSVFSDSDQSSTLSHADDPTTSSSSSPDPSGDNSQRSTEASTISMTSVTEDPQTSSQNPGGLLVSLLADATSITSFLETTSSPGDDAGQTDGAHSSAQTSTDSASAADPGASLSPTVISIAGAAYTVAQSGSVLSVGSKAVTMGEAPITFGAQTIRFASSGLVVGASTAILVHSDPQITASGESLTISAETQVITAVRSGSNVILAVGSTSTQVAGGNTVILGGQSISVQSDGNGVVVGDSSTLSFGTGESASDATTAIVGDSTYVIASGISGVFVVNGITASPNSVATVGGQAVSNIDGSGLIVGTTSIVLHDGASSTTVARDTANTELGAGPSAWTESDQPAVDIEATSGSGAAATVTADGQRITISQVESGLLVHDYSSTISLPAGSQVLFNDHTISVATDIFGLVVDGSSTVTLNSKTSEPAGLTMHTVIRTNGHEFTAVASGNNILLEDGTSRATISAANVVTFEGQTVSALRSANGIVINGGSTASLTASQQIEQVVIIGQSQAMTAISVLGSSGIVFEDADLTTTLTAGATFTFDGQTIAVPTAGNGIVVNGASTVIFTTQTQPSQLTPTADGQLFTVLQSDGSVILEDATSTLTLSASQTATFAGETLVALADVSGVVVDGTSTVLLESPTVIEGAAPEAVISASGHHFTIVPSAGMTLLEAGNRTITLSNGLVTVLEDQTVSVGSTGGIVVVDGSTRTLDLTSSSEPGGAETAGSGSKGTSTSDGSATTTTSKSGARGRAAGQRSALWTCASCIVVTASFHLL